jgi:hypothetical protein
LDLNLGPESAKRDGLLFTTFGRFHIEFFFNKKQIFLGYGKSKILHVKCSSDKGWYSN